MPSSGKGDVQMVVGERGKEIIEEKISESLQQNQDQGESPLTGFMNWRSYKLMVLKYFFNILQCREQNPNNSALVPNLCTIIQQNKNPAVTWIHFPERLSNHLPSVVIHTWSCQSSATPSGFIKLFLPNTYSAVSERVLVNTVCCISLHS